MTTVFLADDHQMFRQGLRTLLEAAANIEVVGEASDGQKSLRDIKKLKPMFLFGTIHQELLEK